MWRIHGKRRKLVLCACQPRDLVFVVNHDDQLPSIRLFYRRKGPDEVLVTAIHQKKRRCSILVTHVTVGVIRVKIKKER